MPDRFLYLLLDVGAISVPFACSFYTKAPFIKTLGRIMPAILLPMTLFVVWDVFFTKWGIWGFNDTYLIGVRFLGLPLEEWLFFICIPYACLFTYFAIKQMIPTVSERFNYFAMDIGVIVLAVGLLNLNKAYTATTGIGLGILLIYMAYMRKPYLAQFFLSYLFILIPFFIINGVLTGSWIPDQVVWYNDAENLGIRLGTIPIEDFFYGMLLLLLNTLIWEELI